MTERPDQNLIERGWRFREHPMGGCVYAKEGTYGWFDAVGAYEHERLLADGVVTQQYPTEKEGT